MPYLFHEQERQSLSEDLHASFRQNSPNIDELVDVYDIVYTYSDGRTYKQHSARGGLILTSKFISDMDGLGLYVFLEMSPLLSDCTEHHGGIFSFVQSADNACHGFEVPIAVAEYPFAAYQLRSKGERTGTIRLLAEQIATRWNPEEDPEEDPWSDSWEKRIVSFDSVDEAEVLVKRREETFLANS